MLVLRALKFLVVSQYRSLKSSTMARGYQQGRKKKQKGQNRGGRGRRRDRDGGATCSTGDKHGADGADKEEAYHAYSYEPVEKKNEAFEKYYKEQKIVPEGEWDKFMTSLRDELPVTFRITGYRSHAQHMLSYLKGHYIDALVDQTVDGKMLERPKPMAWYPDELAWQFSVTKKTIRKLPAYKKLHDFLVTETESGNISRQEAVSMIPPLLLDIKPHHKVLDMCAAPGSKTAQLIELIHAEQVYGWPEGFVVANDSDNKRCYIMVHQAKRLNSPCCMIVNHDATVFPTIKVPQGGGKKPTALKYDRILCDVPCSGDGTLKKNYLIWKKWTPSSGLNLHIVQHRILQRGAELLEVGGRMVYSTCSFNPIENEAVVASVLQKCEGALELIDVSNELPGLKRAPGLTSWKVINDAGEAFASLEDVPEEKRQRYRASLWPPTAEEAEKLHLTRCMRVFPHHQDTGGFFVAVLRKVAALPWMKQAGPSMETPQVSTMAEAFPDDTIAGQGEAMEAQEESMKEELSNKDPIKEPTEVPTEVPTEEPTSEELPGAPTNMESFVGQPLEDSAATSSNDGPPPPKKKKMFQGYKEDPFVFFKGDEEIWPPIKKFYAVEDNFPVTQLLTRCYVGKKRNLYMVNNWVKAILETNEDHLKVINSGVKVWSRSDAKDVPCDFRLAQEGIYSIFPYLSARKICNITKEDVRTLLTQENPFCFKLEQEAREATSKVGQGSLIFVYDPKQRDPESNDMSFILVGWRGKNSVRSYIPKGERQHILRMCDIDIPSDDKDTSQEGDT